MSESYALERHPTGSRYICSPPPMDTDDDTVVLALRGYEEALIANGFDSQSTDLEYDMQGDFVSWRRGDENFIVTTDEQFYRKFVKATKIAKALNLMEKGDRITLFQAILYNNY